MKADRAAGGKPTGPDTVTFPDGARFRVDLFPSPRLTDEDENSVWSYESRGGGADTRVRMGRWTHHIGLDDAALH